METAKDDTEKDYTGEYYVQVKIEIDQFLTQTYSAW